MRQHRSVLLATGSLILAGLAGCVSDTTTSSSAPPPPSSMAQADQGKEQPPPSGEVQERAVVPGLAPGAALTQPVTISITLGGTTWTMIPGFQWARAEAGASANLHVPRFG